MTDTAYIPDEAKALILGCHAELVSASIVQWRPESSEAKWTLKQVQGDGVCGG